jgi:hypothetical protein
MKCTFCIFFVLRFSQMIQGPQEKLYIGNVMSWLNSLTVFTKVSYKFFLICFFFDIDMYKKKEKKYVWTKQVDCNECA